MRADVRLSEAPLKQQAEYLKDAEMTAVVAKDGTPIDVDDNVLLGDKVSAASVVSGERRSGSNKTMSSMEEMQTGLSFFQPAEEMDFVKVELASPDTVRQGHGLGMVALTMMDFDAQEPTKTLLVSEDNVTKTEVSDTLGSNLPSIAHPEHVEIPSDTGNLFAKSAVESDLFQRQLALQEHELKQQQQQQQQDSDPEQARSSFNQTGSGFKLRRKRNNSTYGKKLQLKKSLPNLHGSFQQQGLDQVDNNSNNTTTTLPSPTSPTTTTADNVNHSESTTPTEAVPTGPSNYVIPRFYFPMGKPVSASKRRQRTQNAMVNGVTDMKESAFFLRCTHLLP